MEYAHSRIGVADDWLWRTEASRKSFCRVSVVGFTRVASKLHDVPSVCLYHIYKWPTVLSRSCGQLRFKEFITISSLPHRADGGLTILLCMFGLLLPPTLYMTFSEKDSLVYSVIQSSPLCMLPSPFPSWDSCGLAFPLSS